MLPSRDFGTDVLQRDPQRLRVVTVPPCGWVDPGAPERVSRWLEQHRDSPMWRNIEATTLGPSRATPFAHPSPGHPG